MTLHALHFHSPAFGRKAANTFEIVFFSSVDAVSLYVGNEAVLEADSDFALDDELFLLVAALFKLAQAGVGEP